MDRSHAGPAWFLFGAALGSETTFPKRGGVCAVKRGVSTTLLGSLVSSSRGSVAHRSAAVSLWGPCGLGGSPGALTPKRGVVRAARESHGVPSSTFFFPHWFPTKNVFARTSDLYAYG